MFSLIDYYGFRSEGRRTPKERELYTDGAEIPVHLVYEKGDGTEAIVKEVSDSKDPMLNRVAREPVRRRIQQFQTYASGRRERSPLEPVLTTVTNIVEYGREGCEEGRRNRRAIPQHAGQLPIREGPSIVKLKVRRGGVAIAGPGGVATAGSGGTAIVGPGGTAYTTQDGTAVVGPGGRLIELGSYVSKGRSDHHQEGRIIATGPVIYYPMHF